MWGARESLKKTRVEKKARWRCTKACTALQQSELEKWFFFLLFFFSFFFFSSSSWLRKKSQVPAELEMDNTGAASLRLCLALQSHPGRGILKRPALLRSPSMVSCKYLILSLFVSLFISQYLSLAFFCGHIWNIICLFLTPSFIFILTFKRNTLPPPLPNQSAFLTSLLEREEGMSPRKGSSLCIQNHNELFVIPAEYKESHKQTSQWNYKYIAQYKGERQCFIWYIPYRFKVPLGHSVMEQKYWRVSWKQD